MHRYVTAGTLAAGLKTQPAMGHTGLVVIPGVALQAKLPPFTPHQQHAVGAAVRGVASGATLHFRRRVLIDIRPALLRMAVHATLKIRFVQAGVVQRAVRIVAVAALDQALRHAMMHGQRKLRLHGAMAVEAQRRLRLLQQAALQPANLVRKLRHLIEMALRRTQVAFALVFHFLHQVRGVALIAGQTMRYVCRVLEEFLLLAADVTQQATGGVLF